MRYFIQFAYNGTNYHGWQFQPTAISVQEVLTKALNILFKDPFELIGAGRTDAGVHAKLMYAHFDTDVVFDAAKMVQKLNSFLPEDITVFNFFEVDKEAHARFDAVSRSYEYHIHTFKNSFLKNLSYYQFKNLDIDKMNEAARILLLYEDFECFSKTHTDVFTFNCNITTAYWEKNGSQLIFHISANRFLRNMVRAIVGTLINVGIGKISVQDVHEIIQSKNRGNAGFSVPAHGLYLTKVVYPYINETN
ncbi:tRNA pseudouridine(38-40) synthase TruA [Flavobacterium sp. CBA20B-1]|uniref:tRNA pseudouridine(38-40) synthase TruA n=1 Tax=unclassified Flavobacterium TaxID=196869 RepID=UPI002224BF4D|nr:MULTISPECIES: tRNA pseudouridine(38-40) synthase TruA [unclassified Flavobacterium]WCM42752.1 tRNA pseudouridine(38-40) synthase TruA [Flavobacterium sp. CBA20B-1]